MKTKIILLVAFFAFATSSVSAQFYAMKKVLITEVVDKSEDGLSQGTKAMIRAALTSAITASEGCVGYDTISILQVDSTFDRHGNVTKTILSYVQKQQMEYVLVTEATPLDKSTILLSARIIKTDTGKIVGTSSIRTVATLNCLQSSSRTLANNLIRSIFSI